MRRATLLVGAAWLLTISINLCAAPFLPTDGQQIIERLPSLNDPLQRELQAQRQQLTANPSDAALAVELARRYIELARRDSDPRYNGYAEAALAAWWQNPNPPVEIRLLRATLRQSNHEFEPALADLDAVLKVDRDHPQAWLTRATVLTVQGEFALAKQSCARLYRLASELISVTCLANVGSVSGQLKPSYALLDQTLTKNPDQPSTIRLWALTLLAEMAQRAGENNAAARHFKQALTLASDDSYLLAAYADFLLEQRQAAQVLTLLKDKTRADGLLLRYALALRQQKRPEANARIAELQARFDAAARRGDNLHRREQARFELELANQPAAALTTAQQNFEVQKEPADVRILWQAAQATQHAATLEKLRVWLKQTGLEDVALTGAGGVL